MTKPIEYREADFKRQVENFPGYHSQMLNDFFEYWSEPNKSGTRMRFEQEKTWHLGRRLSRWANNGFKRGFDGNKTDMVAVKAMKTVEPQGEIGVLDELLRKHREHPADTDFKGLAKYYELLKRERLLKVFTVAEVNHIKDIYKGDNEKCRCACVLDTLNAYGLHGITFSDIMKARQKLEPA